VAQIRRIYVCEDCDRHASTIDSKKAPLCPVCRGLMTWKQTREHKPENHGWSTGMRAPAIDFNQTQGRVAPIGGGIEVNSLRDIRRIERESEQAVRDGVPGAERVIFRKYSQDRSNLHTHTMGEAPEARPSKEFLRKQKGSIGSNPGAEELGMGPGAQEELASYLPDEPTSVSE
jgi:DNA-directed RNA polymerase subunit RPC12/RpoP